MHHHNSTGLITVLPTFEAALAGEISYGTNMSVPRVGGAGYQVQLTPVVIFLVRYVFGFTNI